MALAEAVVPPELAAFLGSGLVLVVGTRDADLRPDCAIGAGLRVHADGRHVTIFLGTQPAAGTIENLRTNGAVAITASRPTNYRTFQLKGRAVRIEPTSDRERETLLAYREAFVRELEAVGWPRSIARRLSVWPCVTVDVELAAVFEQTPGPRAGSMMGRP